MSQGATQVPTTGPLGPTAFAGDINAATAALVSTNSGAAAPANGPSNAAILGQQWLDTSSALLPILRMYDGASWCALAILDATNHVWQYVVPGVIFLTGKITPTALAANTNDYAPTNAGIASRWRLSSSVDTLATSWDLTGIAAGADGRRITLDNINSNSRLVLKTQSGSSSAVNRFAFPFDIVLRPNESVALIYDGTSSRWRLDGPYRGPAMTIQTFTAVGAATYTPTSAAVTWIRARWVGAGGGTGTTIGSIGTKTTFNGIDAAPGSPGAVAVGAGPGAGGLGGTGGAGAASLRRPGGPGGKGCAGTGNGTGVGGINYTGGHGGNSMLGFGSAADIAGVANSGGGAGAPSVANATAGAGASPGGAGAGEYCELIISNPSMAGYALNIGDGGAAGGSGFKGGSGYVIVEEYYN